MANRTFHGVAMPQGDTTWGVPGPLVMLVEHGPDGRGGFEVKRTRIFDLAETEAARDQLSAAIAHIRGQA